MVNTAYLQYILFLLVTLCTQCILRVQSNDLVFNRNHTDSGNYINLAGKRFQIQSRETNFEDIFDLSRSFLRDGTIGSLVRDFEDIQTQSSDLHHRRHSKRSGKVNVFSAEKQKESPYEVSLTCLNDTKQVMLDILARQPYAIEMLDADTKIPSGIVQGHWLWLGNYDECKSVQSPKLPSGHQINGQYCLTITTKYIAGYKPISLGTCVPSSCSKDDVKALVRSLIDTGSGPPKTVTALCEQKKTYSKGDITALVVFGILGLLVCVGTLIDVYFRCMDENRHRTDINRQVNGRVIQTNERTGLLSSTSISLEDTQQIYSSNKEVTVKRWPMLTSLMTSFSFVKNTAKLMSTSTASSPLSSLNGMRVLSMWWVILGHTYEIPVSSSILQNPIQAVKLGQRFTFQAVLNGTFSVDTFFFMSGALVTYLCLKDMAKNHGRARWGLFYFHRVWRLTPAYAFCLMIFATMTKHFNTGPYSILYDLEFADQYDTCSKTWWTNLLYINNFYPDSGDLGKICMAWTWYLANDMQFFIISPLFIILLLRQVPTKHTDDVYGTNTTYNRPYTRIAPYMVGMVIGYMLHNNDCRARLNKICVLIGWSLAVVMGILPVYGLYYYYDNVNESANLVLSAFYISCSRLSWSLAVAWVIYACATGYGGPVNKILSWTVWAPLGRLTYCAYLVHPIIIVAYGFNLPVAFFFSDLTVVYMYMGNLVSSYIIAYLVSMVIEAPMMGLEKVLFKR